MEENEITSSLQTTRLAHYLDPQQLNTLLERNRIVTFSPGEIILKQGKKSEGLYIILDGNAVVTAKILGEGVFTLDTLGHGNFAGEISLIENGPCATSVIAKSELSCLLISNNYFDMMELFFPEMKFQLTRAIMTEVCERLVKTHKKIIDVMTRTDIAPLSLFNKVIQTFNKPSISNLYDLGITAAEIRKFSFFNIFNDEEYEELLNNIIVIKAGERSTLIQQGEISTSFFIILRGAVQSSIVQDNKYAKLSVLGPNNLFASITFIDDTIPSIIHYSSYEQAILFKISQDSLNKIQKNNISLWYKIYHLVSQSFVELERAADKLDIRLNSEFYNR